VYRLGKKHKEEMEMKKVDVFDRNLSNVNLREELPRLRFSRFAHDFIRNGIVALYHSLTHQVVYLQKEDYQVLKKKIEKVEDLESGYRSITDDLVKHGILVSLAYREDEILEQIRRNFLGKPAFGILYLLLTDACNLRCRYCFVEEALPSGHEFSYMDADTARRGLRFFANTITKNPSDRKIDKTTIIFYGGEPLLNKEAFLASISEIEKLKKEELLSSNSSITLLTNATVLDNEVIDALLRSKISVSVSLDGPQDIHDKNRIFANQQGTFQTVFENIKRLKEEGVQVGISCTISRQNLGSLEEIFNWFTTELDIRGLGFNMLIDLPEVAQADKVYAKIATRKIINCYKIAREKAIYEDRMMRKVKAFVNQSLHLVDCGGCGNQIVITAKGLMGPCHAYMPSNKFFPGNLNNPDFDPFEDPIFREWSSRSPFNIPECQYCSAIGLCGGGCPYNADLKRGSIWLVDPNFCIHSKEILEWLIWDLYEKIKGV